MLLFIYMEMLMYVILAVFGAGMGSFAGAQVWRIRAWHLASLQASGDISATQKRELQRLSKIRPPKSKSGKAKLSDDRSKCLNCGYQLQALDLVPIFSWLFLRGKCRSCHKFIGWFEFIIEVSLALAFVLSAVFWPLPIETVWQWAYFVAWCAMLVPLAILFAYDAKWSILPDIATLFFTILAVLVSIFGLLASGGNFQDWILGISGGVLVLSGVYAAIYYYSRYKNGEEGTWVGFGDVKLSVGLGILAGSFSSGFMTLFLANLLGLLVILPAMLRGKINRNSHIPFGPFLILGGVLSFFIGKQIFYWYTGLYIG